MECHICQRTARLYLYNRGDMIYSLCGRCMRIQESLDRITEFKRDQIKRAKDDPLSGDPF